MTTSDVDAVVDVHLRSFPAFFLTFLGRRFLRLLYRYLLDDPEGIALVTISDEGVDGFVAGVTQQAGFYRRLIRNHGVAFAWASIGPVIRRPAIALRLLRALRRPQDAQQAAAEACLMSLAVAPDRQRGGLGAELVRAFCSELALRNVKAVCLTTDRDGNDAVNGFYRKLGFRVSRTFETHEGRAMNEWVVDIK